MEYLVESVGGRKIKVKAQNAVQAKRKACKAWNIKVSDKWCGAATMKAKRVI